MEDNIHDVVKLLLARMESHPEEFWGSGEDFIADEVDRWWKPLVAIRDFGTEQENALIKAKLREIRLQKAHEAAMDELLNGEDRRRKAEEEREYERNLLKNLQNQAYTSSLQNQMNALGNQVTGSFGKPLMATPHPVGPAQVPSRHPTSSDMENNGIMSALRKAFK